MSGTILVPLELSEKSDRALGLVAELALGCSKRIALLHVIETIRDAPFEELKEFYQSLEDRSRAQLETRRDTLADSGLEVTIDVRYGNRVREILNRAEEDDVDLIVMGSHAVDEKRPGSGLATISYQVAALSPCSILLAK